MKAIVLGCFILCLGLALSGSVASEEASEISDLLSPTVRLLSPRTSNSELAAFTGEGVESKNLVETGKSILDIILAIPRKIILIIKRIINAVYLYWVLVFRTIFRFIGGVLSTIKGAGFGIANFFQELLSIAAGVVAFT